MDNVTDFLAYKESRKKVESLLASADVSKLSANELSVIVQSLGKLTTQQSDILQTLMIDLTLLVERQQEMQQQFMYVSGQAYLALQLLKEKNVCTPEEVETAWQTMVQDKILKPQEQTEIPLDKPAELNESD